VPTIDPEGKTAERVAVGVGVPASWIEDDIEDPRRSVETTGAGHARLSPTR
jgi:hypothetical protein